MKFKYFKYQHKGDVYRDALLSNGFTLDSKDPDFILIDRDAYISNAHEPRKQLLMYPNVPVILYPHSPLPLWWYDGLVPLRDYIKCAFVIGEGQKIAMQKIEPRLRVETSGWGWSELVPFKKPERIRKVLFAPAHPTQGLLRPEAKEANRAIFEELKNHKHLEVTVRYMGDLEAQGLEYDYRFKMVEGRASGRSVELERSDLVIAEGTMMYLAVARGKPTIGFGQQHTLRPNKDPDKYIPHNWQKYGGDIAYPLNFGDAPFLQLVEQAQ